MIRYLAIMVSYKDLRLESHPNDSTIMILHCCSIERNEAPAVISQNLPAKEEAEVLMTLFDTLHMYTYSINSILLIVVPPPLVDSYRQK